MTRLRRPKTSPRPPPRRSRRAAGASSAWVLGSLGALIVARRRRLPAVGEHRRDGGRARRARGGARRPGRDGDRRGRRRGCWRPASGESDTGLVFIPGAKVDPLAYAATLVGSVEEGATVVITKPTLNLAFFDFRPCRLHRSRPEVDDWSVGGHSLGGVRACQLAEGTDGLVLFGSYCANDLSESGLAALSISGSEDGLSTPREDRRRRAPAARRHDLRRDRGRQPRRASAPTARSPATARRRSRMPRSGRRSPTPSARSSWTGRRERGRGVHNSSDQSIWPVLRHPGAAPPHPLLRRCARASFPPPVCPRAACPRPAPKRLGAPATGTMGACAARRRRPSRRPDVLERAGADRRALTDGTSHSASATGACSACAETATCRPQPRPM